MKTSFILIISSLIFVNSCNTSSVDPEDVIDSKQLEKQSKQSLHKTVVKVDHAMNDDTLAYDFSDLMIATKAQVISNMNPFQIENDSEKNIQYSNKGFVMATEIEMLEIQFIKNYKIPETFDPTPVSFDIKTETPKNSKIEIRNVFEINTKPDCGYLSMMIPLY